MHHAFTVGTPALALLLATAPIAGHAESLVEPEQIEQLDYSVCRNCDVRSAEDEEVIGYAEMIARARWEMNQRSHGLIEVRDGDGNLGRFRWTAQEGTLEELVTLPADRVEDG